MKDEPSGRPLCENGFPGGTYVYPLPLPVSLLVIRAVRVELSANLPPGKSPGPVFSGATPSSVCTFPYAIPASIAATRSASG